MAAVEAAAMSQWPRRLIHQPGHHLNQGKNPRDRDGAIRHTEGDGDRVLSHACIHDCFPRGLDARSVPGRFSRHAVDQPDRQQEAVQPPDGFILGWKSIHETASTVGKVLDDLKARPHWDDLVAVHTLRCHIASFVGRVGIYVG